jgi:hypothetical protein
MGGKKILWVMALVLFGHVGAAWAAAAAVCAADEAEPPRPIGPYVRETTDPATGATMVLRRDVKGQISIELRRGSVSVRKAFDGAAAITTLSSGSQRVSISVSGNEIVVTAPGRRLGGTVVDLRSLEASAEYLRHSPPAIAAKRLLDQVALRPDAIEGNAMLLTKALLGSMWGESAGTVQYQRWAKVAIPDTKVVRARSLEGGPGGCWDAYAAEAIRIMDDYTQCGGGCGWSGYFCLGACGFIYDLRAEGAFMWFMRCNGGFYVN